MNSISVPQSGTPFHSAGTSSYVFQINHKDQKNQINQKDEKNQINQKDEKNQINQKDEKNQRN